MTNLGELIVELKLDSAQFTADLNKFKADATKVAGDIEQKINSILSKTISIKVDDKSLTKLNEHLDKKKKHLDEVKKHYESNPIVVKVDNKESEKSLKNFNTKLEQELKKNKKYTIDYQSGQGLNDVTKVVKDAVTKGIQQAFTNVKAEINVSTSRQSTNQVTSNTSSNAVSDKNSQYIVEELKVSNKLLNKLIDRQENLITKVQALRFDGSGGRSPVVTQETQQQNNISVKSSSTKTEIIKQSVQPSSTPPQSPPTQQIDVRQLNASVNSLANANANLGITISNMATAATGMGNEAAVANAQIAQAAIEAKKISDELKAGALEASKITNDVGAAQTSSEIIKNNFRDASDYSNDIPNNLATAATDSEQIKTNFNESNKLVAAINQDFKDSRISVKAIEALFAGIVTSLGTVANDLNNVAGKVSSNTSGSDSTIEDIKKAIEQGIASATIAKNNNIEVAIQSSANQITGGKNLGDVVSELTKIIGIINSLDSSIKASKSDPTKIDIDTTDLQNSLTGASEQLNNFKQLVDNKFIHSTNVASDQLEELGNELQKVITKLKTEVTSPAKTSELLNTVKPDLQQISNNCECEIKVVKSVESGTDKVAEQVKNSGENLEKGIKDLKENFKVELEDKVLVQFNAVTTEINSFVTEAKNLQKKVSDINTGLDSNLDELNNNNENLKQTAAALRTELNGIGSLIDDIVDEAKKHFNGQPISDEINEFANKIKKSTSYLEDNIKAIPNTLDVNIKAKMAQQAQELIEKISESTKQIDLDPVIKTVIEKAAASLNSFGDNSSKLFDSLTKSVEFNTKKIEQTFETFTTKINQTIDASANEITASATKQQTNKPSNETTTPPGSETQKQVNMSLSEFNSAVAATRDELLSILSGLNTESTSATKNIESLKASLAKLTDETDQLQTKFKDVANNKDIDKLFESIGKLNDEYDNLNPKVKENVNKQTDLIAKLNDIVDELTTINSLTKEGQQNKLKEIEDLKKTVAELQTNGSNFNNAIVAITEKVSTSTNTINDLNAQNLTQAKAAEQVYQKLTQVLTKIEETADEAQKLSNKFKKEANTPVALPEIDTSSLSEITTYLDSIANSIKTQSEKFDEINNVLSSFDSQELKDNVTNIDLAGKNIANAVPSIVTQIESVAAQIEDAGKVFTGKVNTFNLDELSSRLNNLKDVASNLGSELSGLKVVEMQQKIDSIETDVDSFNKSIQDSRTNVSEINQLINNVKIAVKNYEGIVQKSNSTVEETITAQSKVVKSLDDLNAKYRLHQTTIDNINNKHNELFNNISNLASEIGKNENAIKAFSNNLDNVDFNSVVNGLKELSGGFEESGKTFFQNLTTKFNEAINVFTAKKETDTKSKNETPKQLPELIQLEESLNDPNLSDAYKEVIKKTIEKIEKDIENDISEASIGEKIKEKLVNELDNLLSKIEPIDLSESQLKQYVKILENAASSFGAKLEKIGEEQANRMLGASSELAEFSNKIKTATAELERFDAVVKNAVTKPPEPKEKAALEKATDSSDKLKESLQGLTSITNDVSKTIQNLGQKFTKLEEFENLKQSITGLDVETRKFSSQVKLANTYLESLDFNAKEAESNKFKSIAESFESTLKALISVADNLKQANTSFVAEVNVLKTSVTEIDVNTFNDKAKELTSVVNGLKDKLNEINQELLSGKDIGASLAKFNSELKEAQQQYKNLASLQSSVNTEHAKLQTGIQVFINYLDNNKENIVAPLKEMVQTFKSDLAGLPDATQESVEKSLAQLEAKITSLDTIFSSFSNKIESFTLDNIEENFQEVTEEIKRETKGVFDLIKQYVNQQFPSKPKDEKISKLDQESFVSKVDQESFNRSRQGLEASLSSIVDAITTSGNNYANQIIEATVAAKKIKETNLEISQTNRELVTTAKNLVTELGNSAAEIKKATNDLVKTKQDELEAVIKANKAVIDAAANKSKENATYYDNLKQELNNAVVVAGSIKESVIKIKTQFDELVKETLDSKKKEIAADVKTLIDTQKQELKDNQNQITKDVNSIIKNLEAFNTSLSSNNSNTTNLVKVNKTQVDTLVKISNEFESILNKYKTFSSEVDNQVKSLTNLPNFEEAGIAFQVKVNEFKQASAKQIENLQTALKGVINRLDSSGTELAGKISNVQINLDSTGNEIKKLGNVAEKASQNLEKLVELKLGVKQQAELEPVYATRKESTTEKLKASIPETTSTPKSLDLKNLNEPTSSKTDKPTSSFNKDVTPITSFRQSSSVNAEFVAENINKVQEEHQEKFVNKVWFSLLKILNTIYSQTPVSADDILEKIKKNEPVFPPVNNIVDDAILLRINKLLSEYEKLITDAGAPNLESVTPKAREIAKEMGETLVNLAKKTAEEIQEKIGDKIALDKMLADSDTNFEDNKELAKYAKSGDLTKEIKVLTDALYAIKIAAKEIGGHFSSLYKTTSGQTEGEFVGKSNDIRNDVIKTKSYNAANNQLISEIQETEKYIRKLIAELDKAAKNFTDTGSETIDAKTRENLKKSLTLFSDFVNRIKQDLKIKSPSQVAIYIGEMFGEGLSIGIKEGANKVIKTASEMAKNLVKTVKKQLGINSKSKIFFEIGINLLEGFESGIEMKMPGVQNLINSLFHAISAQTPETVGAEIGTAIILSLALSIQKGDSVISKAFRKIVNNILLVVDIMQNSLDVYSGPSGLFPNLAPAVHPGIGLTIYALKTILQLLKEIGEEHKLNNKRLLPSLFDSAKNRFNKIRNDKSLNVAREGVEHVGNIIRGGEMAQFGAKSPIIAVINAAQSGATVILRSIRIIESMYKAYQDTVAKIQSNPSIDFSATFQNIFVDYLRSFNITKKDILQALASIGQVVPKIDSTGTGKIISDPTAGGAAVGAAVAIELMDMIKKAIIDKTKEKMAQGIDFKDAFKASLEDIQSPEAITKILTNVADSLKPQIKNITNAGEDIVDGLTKGILSRMGMVARVIYLMGKGIKDQIKENMGITSPSKVMIEVGLMITEGLAIGIKKGTNKVLNAIEFVGNAIKQKELPQLTDKETKQNINTDVTRRLKHIGKQTSQGFTQGLRSNSMAEETGEEVRKVIKKFKTILKIASPSQVTRQFGINSGEGYGIGFVEALNKSNKKIQDTLKNIVQSLEAEFSAVGVNSSFSDELQDVLTKMDNIEEKQKRIIELRNKGSITEKEARQELQRYNDELLKQSQLVSKIKRDAQKDLDQRAAVAGTTAYQLATANDVDDNFANIELENQMIKQRRRRRIKPVDIRNVDVPESIHKGDDNIKYAYDRSIELQKELKRQESNPKIKELKKRLERIRNRIIKDYKENNTTLRQALEHLSNVNERIIEEFYAEGGSPIELTQDNIRRNSKTFGQNAQELGQGIADVTEQAQAQANRFGDFTDVVRDFYFEAAQKILDLVKAMEEIEPIQRRFLVAMNDNKQKADRAFKLAQSTAEQNRIPIISGLEGYSQMLEAAKGTRLEGADVQNLFEGISAALSSMSITGRDADLVFLAFTQMIARGKVSMEELRQQLSEKFPPAMRIFAKALGTTVSGLTETVSQGLVMSDNALAKVARTLNEEYGNTARGAKGIGLALTELSNTGVAMLIKITESFSDLVIVVAQSLSAITNLIKDNITVIAPIAAGVIALFSAALLAGMITIFNGTGLTAAILALSGKFVTTFASGIVTMAPVIALAIGEGLASAIGAKTITEMISNKIKEGVDGVMISFNTSGTLGFITNLLNPIALLINAFQFLAKAIKEIPKAIKAIRGFESGFEEVQNILKYLIGFVERIKVGINALIGTITGLSQIFGVFAINVTILKSVIVGSLTAIKVATLALGVVWNSVFGKFAVIIGILTAVMAAMSAIDGSLDEFKNQINTVLAVAGAAIYSIILIIKLAKREWAGFIGLLAVIPTMMYLQGDFSSPALEAMKNLSKSMKDGLDRLKDAVNSFSKETKSSTDKVEQSVKGFELNILKFFNPNLQSIKSDTLILEQRKILNRNLKAGTTDKPDTLKEFVLSTLLGIDVHSQSQAFNYKKDLENNLKSGGKPISVPGGIENLSKREFDEFLKNNNITANATTNAFRNILLDLDKETEEILTTHFKDYFKILKEKAKGNLTVDDQIFNSLLRDFYKEVESATKAMEDLKQNEMSNDKREKIKNELKDIDKKIQAKQVDRAKAEKDYKTEEVAKIDSQIAKLQKDKNEKLDPIKKGLNALEKMKSSLEFTGEMLIKRLPKESQQTVRKGIEKLTKQFGELSGLFKDLAKGDFDESYNKALKAFNAFEKAYADFKNNLETEINVLTASLYKGNYNSATIARGEKILEIKQADANIQALNQKIASDIKMLALTQINTATINDEESKSRIEELKQGLAENRNALTAEDLKKLKLSKELKEEIEENEKALKDYQLEQLIQIKQMQIELEKAKAELENLRLDNKLKVLLKDIKSSNFKSFMESAFNLIKSINEIIAKKLENDKKQLEDQKRLREEAEKRKQIEDQQVNEKAFKNLVIKSNIDLTKAFDTSFKTLTKVTKEASSAIKQLAELIEGIFNRFNIKINKSSNAVNQTGVAARKIGLNIEQSGLNLSKFNNRITIANNSLGKTVTAFQYINNILQTMPQNPVVTINYGSGGGQPPSQLPFSNIGTTTTSSGFNGNNATTVATASNNNNNVVKTNATNIATTPFTPKTIPGANSYVSRLNSNSLQSALGLFSNLGVPYTDNLGAGVLKTAIVAGGIPGKNVGKREDRELLRSNKPNPLRGVQESFGNLPLLGIGVSTDEIKWFQGQMNFHTQNQFNDNKIDPKTLITKINAALRSAKKNKVKLDPELGKAAEFVIDNLLPHIPQSEGRKFIWDATQKRRDDIKFVYNPNDQNEIKTITDIAENYLTPNHLISRINPLQAINTYIDIVAQELTARGSLKDKRIPSPNLKQKARFAFDNINRISPNLDNIDNIAPSNFDARKINTLKENYELIKEIVERGQLTSSGGATANNLIEQEKLRNPAKRITQTLGEIAKIRNNQNLGNINQRKLNTTVVSGSTPNQVKPKPVARVSANPRTIIIPTVPLGSNATTKSNPTPKSNATRGSTVTPVPNTSNATTVPSVLPVSNTFNATPTLNVTPVVLPKVIAPLDFSDIFPKSNPRQSVSRVLNAQMVGQGSNPSRQITFNVGTVLINAQLVKLVASGGLPVGNQAVQVSRNSKQSIPSKTSPPNSSKTPSIDLTNSESTRELNEVNRQIEQAKLDSLILDFGIQFDNIRNTNPGSERNEATKARTAAHNSLLKLSGNLTNREEATITKAEREADIKQQQSTFTDQIKELGKQIEGYNKLITGINNAIQKIQNSPLDDTTKSSYINRLKPILEKVRSGLETATTDKEKIEEEYKLAKPLIDKALGDLPNFLETVLTTFNLGDQLRATEAQIQVFETRKDNLEKIKQQIRNLTKEEQLELDSILTVNIPFLENIREYTQLRLAYLQALKENPTEANKLKARLDLSSKRLQELHNFNIGSKEITEATKDIEQLIADSPNTAIIEAKKGRVKEVSGINYEIGVLGSNKEVLELAGLPIDSIEQKLVELGETLKILENIKLSPGMVELLKGRVSALSQRAKDEKTQARENTISEATIQSLELQGLTSEFQLNAMKRDRLIQNATSDRNKATTDNDNRLELLTRLANDKYNDAIKAFQEARDKAILANPNNAEAARTTFSTQKQQASNVRDAAIKTAQEEQTKQATEINQDHARAIEAANLAHKDFLATLKDSIVVTAKQSIGSELSTYVMNDLVMGVNAVTGEARDLSNELKGLERVLYNVTKAILNSIIQLATKTVVDSALNWFVGLLTPKVGGKALGGVITNYAEGGLVPSIDAAFTKERSLNGGIQPVLAVLTPGERVLTVSQNKRFEELQLNKVLNYANGGIVSSTERQYHQTINNEKAKNTPNIPTTIELNSSKDESNVDSVQLRNGTQNDLVMDVDAVTGEARDLSNELKTVVDSALNSLNAAFTKERSLNGGIQPVLAVLTPGERVRNGTQNDLVMDVDAVTGEARDLSNELKTVVDSALNSLNAAFTKERSLNGGIQPVLAVLTPGERVLTVGQNKRFEELQLNKVLNYANGGMVSPAERQYHQTMNYVNSGYVAPPINSGEANNSQKPENTFNIPITIESNSGKDESNVDPIQLRNAIQNAVLTEIQRQQRQGGFLPRK